jgi:hypothetical protein
MTTQQKQLYKRIDEILWNDWDPIGINDDEIARDEYQTYVPHILLLTMQDADKIKIAGYLHKVETINMGLSGNMQRCREVAQKIIEAKS